MGDSILCPLIVIKCRYFKLEFHINSFLWRFLITPQWRYRNDCFLTFKKKKVKLIQREGQKVGVGVFNLNIGRSKFKFIVPDIDMLYQV